MLPKFSMFSYGKKSFILNRTLIGGTSCPIVPPMKTSSWRTQSSSFTVGFREKLGMRADCRESAMNFHISDTKYVARDIDLLRGNYTPNQNV